MLFKKKKNGSGSAALLPGKWFCLGGCKTQIPKDEGEDRCDRCKKNHRGIVPVGGGFFPKPKGSSESDGSQF